MKAYSISERVAFIKLKKIVPCVFSRVSVVLKKTISSSNIKIGQPKLEDDLFETWKRDLKVWCKLTDITEEKRTLAVHLTLSGRARVDDDLEKKTGIDISLAKLDDIFLVVKRRKQFATYHEIHSYLRSRIPDINKFATEFEHIYYNFSLQGMQLPDPV